MKDGEEEKRWVLCDVKWCNAENHDDGDCADYVQMIRCSD